MKRSVVRVHAHPPLKFRGSVAQSSAAKTIAQKSMRFLLGAIIIVLGILLMCYTVWVTDQVTGEIDWAEKVFGNGFTAGTYTWWRLCGLLAIILSICWMFGWLSFGM